MQKALRLDSESLIFYPVENKPSPESKPGEKIFFFSIDYKFSLDKTIKIVYIEAVKTISLVQRRIYI